MIIKFECFYYSLSGSLEEWKVIKKNAEQIFSYINVYNDKHNLLEEEELQKIKNKFKSALNVDENIIRNFENESRNLMQVMMDTREKFRSIWAKFDVGLMATGIIIFFTSILFILCSVKSFFIWSALASFSTLMCLARQSETFLLLSTSIIIIFNGVLASLQLNKNKNKLPNISVAFLSVTLIIPMGITSNRLVDHCLTYVIKMLLFNLCRVFIRTVFLSASSLIYTKLFLLVFR